MGLKSDNDNSACDVYFPGNNPNNPACLCDIDVKCDTDNAKGGCFCVSEGGTNTATKPIYDYSTKEEEIIGNKILQELRLIRLQNNEIIDRLSQL